MTFAPPPQKKPIKPLSKVKNKIQNGNAVMLHDIMYKVTSESYSQTTITSDRQSLRSRQDGRGDLFGPLLFLSMNHFALKKVWVRVCVGGCVWWLQCVVGLLGQQLSYLNLIPLSLPTLTPAASEMRRKSRWRREVNLTDEKWNEVKWKIKVTFYSGLRLVPILLWATFGWHHQQQQATNNSWRILVRDRNFTTRITRNR